MTFFNNKKKRKILHKNIKYVFHEITLWIEKQNATQQKVVEIHYTFGSNAKTMSIIKHCVS